MTTHATTHATYIEVHDPKRLGESACPACGKTAYLVPDADRHFHADGSDNAPCWLAILRGLRP